MTPGEENQEREHSLFHPSVYEEILKAWNRPQGGETASPALQDIAALVDLAFRLSVRKEEDLEITTSLAFVPLPKRVELLGDSDLDVLEYRPGTPADAEDVAKLALSCAPSESTLLISEDTSRSGYVLWGHVLSSGLQSRFDEVPVGIYRFASVRPNVFTVSITGPATLLITSGNMVLGQIVDWAFHEAVPSPLEFNAMGRHIIDRVLRGNPLLAKYKTRFWHEYRDALALLIEQIRARVSGATVIIVPQDLLKACSKDYRARQSASCNLRLLDLIGMRLAESSPEEPLARITGGLGFGQQVSRRLAFLSQLAAIDGALITTTALDPVAVGAKLHADIRVIGSVVEGENSAGGGGQTFPLERYGTRHSSAAAFVAAHSPAFGFVFSHDGPVRAFIMGENGALLCWPDCRLSAFR